jgi:hypothetical protein
MVRFVERLSDRMLSMFVPGVEASAATAAYCPSPTCVGGCWCSECSGAWRAACCQTGGGNVICNSCLAGC